MPAKLFIDTGGFFAFLNQSDANHPKAIRRMSGPDRKITSNYVFDELMTLLSARGRRDLSLSFGEQLRDGRLIDYHFLTSREEEKGWEFYKKFRDHPLSFTDCTTLVLLKELKIPSLLSFDTTLLNLAQSLKG